MTVRSLTITAMFAAAALFSFGVPLPRLFDAVQPMITALAIMVAAVLVRLNRGMPTLEWKSLQPDKRSVLTGKIVDINIEYGRIAAIVGFALLGLLSLLVVGKADVYAFWPSWAQRSTSGAIGAVGALCLARMAYVVWRDIDVTRLQAHLIDAMAVQQHREEQTARADRTVASIRSAGLRKVEVSPPKAWGE